MNAQKLLEKYVTTKDVLELGHVQKLNHVNCSSMVPFSVFPGYIAEYPEIVIRALIELYEEYNREFAHLAKKNAEWETDYQHCFLNGMSINFGVQIDMVGLPQGFLSVCDSMPYEEVRETLRAKIFEIENSLAMYHYLQELFCRGEKPSYFKFHFRNFLNDLRIRFGKKIALLAVTEEKYFAMKEMEFGKKPNEILTDEEVQELSGFDTFLGPEAFSKHVTRNNGCEYLLYVRSSHPVAKLKKPGIEVHSSLLNSRTMRRVIKAHSLTFNIDPVDHPFNRRINDTKEYMEPMGMAFEISALEDLFSKELVEHMGNTGHYGDFKGRRLSKEFENFLTKFGVDASGVASGEIHLRAKPLKESYGCYGHLVGPLTKGRFRSDIRSNLVQRGKYVIQPEMPVPQVHNTSDGVTYAYIDRNFFTITNGAPVFIGGFRGFMPTDSQEGKKRRIHGNSATVWGEVLPLK